MVAATLRPTRIGPPLRAADQEAPRLYWLPVLAAASATAAIIGFRGANAAVILYVLGAATVLMALGSPALGLSTLLAVASIDGITKGVLPGWFTLLYKDVILWICVFRWLVTRRHAAAANIAELRVTILLIIFILWVIAEAANVFSAGLLPAAAGVRSWVGWIPVFFVAYEGLRDRRDILSLCYTAVIIAAGVGAYGVVQQAIGMDHLLRVSPHFEYIKRFGSGVPGKYRIISTTPHPGVFGHYMATVLPIALSLVLLPQVRLRQRLVVTVAAVAIVGGAIASGGRLALASLLTSALLLLLLARNIRALAVGSVVTLIVAFGAIRIVSPEALERPARLFNWSESIDRVVFPLRAGWRAVMKHPLGTGVATGVGLGRALQLLGGRPAVRIAPVAVGMVEGEFGRAFRELGIPGGLLFVALIVYIFASAFSVHRRLRDSRLRFTTGGLLAAMVAVALGLLVGPALYLMPTAAIFWIAYASILRLRPQAAAEGETGSDGEGLLQTRLSDKRP